MANDLTPFDPNTIRDQMVEKMRAVMFCALPDDHIEAALKEEWKKFLEGSHDQYRGRTEPALRRMVREHLHERVKERFETIAKGFDTATIDEAIYARLADIAGKAGESFQKTFWTAIGRNIVGDLISKISNELGRKCSCGAVVMGGYTNCHNCGTWIG